MAKLQKSPGEFKNKYIYIYALLILNRATPTTKG